MKSYMKTWLPVAILASIAVGIIFGFIFGEKMLAVKWIGDLFLNALKMIVVPLVMSSLIVGMSMLGDVRKMGKTGFKTVLFYMATMGISVAVGLTLSNIIQPGTGPGFAEQAGEFTRKGDFSVLDVIMGIIPENLFMAMAEGKILSLIFFSLLFGGILTTMGEKAGPVINFFIVIEDVMIKMVYLILIVSPIGIFGLVAGNLGKAGGGEKFLLDLWNLRFYAFNVILGLSIHAFIVLPAVIWIFARRNPFKYMYNMFSALSTAFSTASSSGTLPVTMDCVTRENGVSRKTAGFVLPLGATINMDGTAMYEAVAAMFIAQVYGVELSAGEQLIVFLTATFAAIGAAGIPEAGLVTMIIVLQAVNLPVEGITLLLVIDWFLDRCRTTVNVWGDAAVAAVIDRGEKPSDSNAGYDAFHDPYAA